MSENKNIKKDEYPKINLTHRRSSRLRGVGPPLSPSFYLARSNSLDSNLERYQNRSPIPSFSNSPKSTLNLVQDTCNYLKQNRSTNSSIGDGKPNFGFNLSGNSSSNFSIFNMCTIPPVSTTNTLTNSTIQNVGQNNLLNPMQNLIQNSPFTDYIEVPKSLINESYKFYGTINDHANFREADDKDQYISASKWLKYLEQRVCSNELARLSLAKATAKGPARTIILDFAGDSNSWTDFKDKVTERYTRRDYKDSAIRIAEVFSSGRKKNQSYELFINEVLHTLQEIHDYTPDLFTPVGLAKSIFLASIPAGLRQKIDVSTSSIPQGIKALEMQLDQNRDRYQIEHRAQNDELLYLKRNSEVRRNVPSETNAVVTVPRVGAENKKGNIFQGTRLVNQENIGQSEPQKGQENPKKGCFGCGKDDHWVAGCPRVRLAQSKNSGGFRNFRNDPRGQVYSGSDFRNDQRGQGYRGGRPNFRGNRPNFNYSRGNRQNFNNFRGNRPARGGGDPRGQVHAVTEMQEEIQQVDPEGEVYDPGLYDNYDYTEE